MKWRTSANDSELVEVLDEVGRKTGRIVTKKQAYKLGLWHAGAHVWIYNTTGQLLMQLRHQDKAINPYTWDISVTSAVPANEEPWQTAINEAKKELGIKLNRKELDFIGVTPQEFPMSYRRSIKAFDWNFIVHKDLDIARLRLNPKEVIKVKWIKPAALLKALQANSQFYAFRDAIVYQYGLDAIRRKMRQ